MQDITRPHNCHSEAKPKNLKQNKQKRKQTYPKRIKINFLSLFPIDFPTTDNTSVFFLSSAGRGDMLPVADEIC